MDLNSISKVLIVKLIDLNFFVTILSALVLIFFSTKKWWLSANQSGIEKL